MQITAQTSVSQPVDTRGRLIAPVRQKVGVIGSATNYTNDPRNRIDVTGWEAEFTQLVNSHQTRTYVREDGGEPEVN